MFRQYGSEHSARTNLFLAGYLAAVAGFVNSGGAVLIGSFTSHVTGSVGRLSTDLAKGQISAALFALIFVGSFFGGAVLASSIIGEDSARTPKKYSVALGFEAGILFVFMFVAGLSNATYPRALDAEASLLSLAMGMQNSLITRLSGAVVRTTHLTGVVTDLGIEAARWLRWHRQRLPLPRIPLIESVRPPMPRPAAAKVILLMTIAASFTTGAVVGAALTFRTSRWSMMVPAVAVLALSVYAQMQKEPRS